LVSDHSLDSGEISPEIVEQTRKPMFWIDTQVCRVHIQKFEFENFSALFDPNSENAVNASSTVNQNWSVEM
jgi:hypothetical protein